MNVTAARKRPTFDRKAHILNYFVENGKPLTLETVKIRDFEKRREREFRAGCESQIQPSMHSRNHFKVVESSSGIA